MSKHLTPEILGLIQDGHLPLEIAKKVLNCEKNLLEPSERHESERETFPDELLVISQALAYRKPTVIDSKAIYDLVNRCYLPEVEGAEAFRESGHFMSLDHIEASIRDGTLSWILVEVPEGRETEEDGSIIAVCSYTSDGLSRKNGEVEGKLGSIRCFAVLSKFHGLCIGQRLLAKVENAMRKEDCIRMMFSVPSPRKSICSWLVRRNFTFTGSMPYPAVGHSLLLADATLSIFLRAITSVDPATCRLDADSKIPLEPETVLRLNLANPAAFAAATPASFSTASNTTTTSTATAHEGTKGGKPFLPPMWRPEMYKMSEMQVTPDVPDVD